MTPEQVLQTLGTKYQVLRASKPPSTANPITFIMLANGKHDAFSVQFVLGKLTYIQHEVTFAAGERPVEKTAFDQLLQKFGPYTEDGGYIGDPYIWQWDGVNHLATKRNRSCDISNAIATNSGISPDFPHLSVPVQFGDCHKSVLVSLYGAGRSTPGELVTGMSEYVEDLAPAYSILNAKANQAKQRDEAERKQGQSVKVPF